MEERSKNFDNTISKKFKKNDEKWCHMYVNGKIVKNVEIDMKTEESCEKVGNVKKFEKKFWNIETCWKLKKVKKSSQDFLPLFHKSGFVVA